MMLSCTACATRYVVDPIALGPAGRTVKCARCGHFWFQEPPPLELDIKASDAEDHEDIVEPAREEEPEPRRSRTYLPSIPSERHQHPATFAGWLTVAALIWVLVAGLWAGRTQLVAAERLYKSVGITVATTPPGEGLESDTAGRGLGRHPVPQDRR